MERDCTQFVNDDEYGYLCNDIPVCLDGACAKSDVIMVEDEWENSGNEFESTFNHKYFNVEKC